jgi:hypothetical protein
MNNYSPYSTGMTAKQAVDALWKAVNIGKETCKIISQETAPRLSDIENECSFWYNTENNKLYRASRNVDLGIVIWFEV